LEYLRKLFADIERLGRNIGSGAVLFIKIRKAGNFRASSALSPQSIRVKGVTMIKLNNTTAKSITAMAAAALLAGLAVLFASIVPEARAETQIAGALHPSFAKGDRLPAAEMGAACSSRGWPYYEQNCQFDLRRPAHEARTVRIIALR
jgi:hypothetical protein